MSARKPILATLVAVGALGVLVAAPAAEALHARSATGTTFGKSGTGAGEFKTPKGVAVDQYGNVYVAESANHRVQKFGPTGQFILMFGDEVNETTRLNICTQTEIVASSVKCKAGVNAAGAGPFFKETSRVTVDNSDGIDKGTVYVSDKSGANSVVDVFDNEGKYLTQLTGSDTPALTFVKPLGAAVDASGNLFVADSDNHVIDEFKPLSNHAYEYVGQISGSPLSSPRGLAVDASGDVYVTNVGIATFEFNPSHVFQRTIDEENSRDVGIGSLIGEAFVEDEAGGQHVADHLAGETYLFGMGQIGASEGVGYSAFNKDVYVSNPQKNNIVIFAEGGALPTVATGGTSMVKSVSAATEGVTNPEGLNAEYYFQYGTGTSYGSQTVTVSAGSGLTNVTATGTLTGLVAETTYHYRLVVVGANGTVYGEDKTVTTPIAVKGVGGCEAPNPQATEASLSGSLEPEGIKTNYWFEYTAGETYAGLQSNSEETEGLGIVATTQTITGLQPNTVYHCRMAAQNAAGVTRGQQGSFLTAALTPTVDSTAASAVEASSATLEGAINPGWAVTGYYFEYGPTSGYGAITSGGMASGHTSVTVTPQTVEGLVPGVTYHFRLIAVNSAGTVYGPDQTFATLPAFAPSVETGLTNDISQNTVTIAGAVDPWGAPTRFEFEMGATTSYGTEIFGDAGSGQGALGVTVLVEGLQPGVTYHYRLVARNAYGTTYGDDHTFTTPGLPAPFTQPIVPLLVPTPSFPAIKEAKPSTKKSLTRAQKLARALKACKKDKSKSKRAACVKQARKQYGPVAKKK